MMCRVEDLGGVSDVSDQGGSAVDEAAGTLPALRKNGARLSGFARRL